jgi:hypothetical protein
MMNQRQRILAYIDQFGSISPFEAFKDLGITKLASRVSELIYQDGISIRKEYEQTMNRYGERVHYMRYYREVDNGKS